MNDDQGEEAQLMLELATAAEQAGLALRKLTDVLRRIESATRLQQLEALEVARAGTGDETAEREMATAAIARAMCARR